MHPQAEEGEVPADTDRTGTELRPHGRIDRRLVLELQFGTVTSRAESDLQPGDLRAHLPGDGEVFRRVTAFDHAVGVALELVSAADLQ